MIGIGLGLTRIGKGVSATPLFPPINTVAPVYSGTSQVGSTLTCTQGTWSPVGTTYAYQHKMDGANVGTNSTTYVIQAGDLGKVPSCTVTATNTDGSTAANSNSLSAVAAAPTASTTFDPANNGGVTLSNGNRTAAYSGPGTVLSVKTTSSIATGKVHIEFTMDVSQVANAVGLATSGVSNAAGVQAQFETIAVYYDGNIYLNSGTTGVVIAGFGAGSVVAFEYDASTRSTLIKCAGASYGPFSLPGTGAAFGMATARNTGQWTVNAGQVAFDQAVTSGYTAWG